MTIKEKLVEYLGDSAEGDTIAKVLRSGLDAEGDTIAKIVASAASESESEGKDNE